MSALRGGPQTVSRRDDVGGRVQFPAAVAVDLQSAWGEITAVLGTRTPIDPDREVRILGAPSLAGGGSPHTLCCS